MSTTFLTQADFDTGSYRIKTGGRYELMSNIVFNPPFGLASTRPDTPVNGFWFCAISIETQDPVEIDGNGYTISESNVYREANLTGLYSHILLGNNSFSGALFGASESRYPDTVAYEAARDVTIENVKFGSASHFGIRGMNNDNVWISQCLFLDNFFSCISLQGCVEFNIKCNSFYGVNRETTVTVEDSQLYLLRLILSQFIEQGVPGAEAYLNALNAYVITHPERFDRIQEYPSNFYGVFVNAGTTSPFPFPISPLDNDIGKAVTDGRSSVHGSICDNTFYNFQVRSFERIGLNSNVQLPPGTSIQMTFFGLNGVLEWLDAFDLDTMTFAPNPFLQAMCFLIAVIYPTLPPQVQALLPSNTLTIAQSVLNADQATFFSNAAPQLGLGDDGNLAKGLFGIRLSASQDIKVLDNRMKYFVSDGPAAMTTANIPGYDLVTNPLPVVRFKGNDAWFIATELCSDITIVRNQGDRLESTHGYVHGIDMANLDSNVNVRCNCVQNLSAPNTIVTETMDAGDAFGFEVSNESGLITFIKNSTKCLQAGGSVSPFPSPSETITLACNTINGC
jgi:hypothetical protein